MGRGAPPTDPWGGGDRITVIDIDAATTEFDIPLCLNGKGIEMEADNPVAEGTEHLEISYSAEPTTTGFRVGYSLDRGQTITWLPAVFGSSHMQTVSVDPTQWEPDASWSFYHQHNLPEPATQECYTGGGSGAWSVLVEAVRTVPQA